MNHSPLTTESQLLERASDLVGPALRRQLWLMFLDRNDVQTPLLMPADVPARPGPRDSGPFSTFIAEVVKAVECSAIVVVFERPGGIELTDDDFAWFELLGVSTGLAGVELRATLLSHSSGIELITARSVS